MAITKQDTVGMILFPKASGLRYHEDLGTWSVYVMDVAGRPVFEVAVDNADPELKIHIGKPAATFGKVQLGTVGTLTETSGRAKRNKYEVSDTPGEFTEHISSTSVQAYVYPRVLRIMADVYVPKIEKPVSENDTKI